MDEEGVGLGEIAAKVGDRVAWWAEVSLGRIRGPFSRMQGELIRIDVVRGRVIQLVVFSDSWTFEVVPGRDLHLVRKIPSRANLMKKCPYREGDVLLDCIGREFVVSQILPNRMLLPEPSKEEGIIPIPHTEEYVEKSDKRRRRHFRRWGDGDNNPYVCRIPRPAAKLRNEEDAAWREELRRSLGVTTIRRNAKVIKRTPVLGKIVRTPVT